MLTRCRSGEILRLRWSEVREGCLCLKEAKTGPRDVLLSKSAIEILDARKFNSNSLYVFASPMGPEKPRGQEPEVWHQIRGDAGLPKDIRQHDLRHTYASHAVMNGESLYLTGKLLGHARTSSTERYTHLDGQHLKTAANRI